ncbi:MAG: M56 family metallopeptidase [Candidatus Acidiferrales bacterium]
MTLPYFLRLLCLCLASFFLVHAALGMAAWLVAPAAIRLAEKMRPRMAARFLFFLRVLPAVLAAIVVLGLGVPSYVWLEPRATEESVSLACCAAALLGAAVWCISIARVFHAALRSSRYARQCKRIGRGIVQEGAFVPTTVLEVESPMIALAGVFRPRVLVSRSVLAALSPGELDAALKHENAHRISRDNLKRFVFLLAPGVFPLTRSLVGLEQAWARFSEWAADDEATRGDTRVSLLLAAALVRVARMGAAPQPSVALSPLIAGDRDLSARVERLLRGEPAAPASIWRRNALLSGLAVVASAIIVGAMQWPAILRAAHEILERLIG